MRVHKWKFPRWIGFWKLGCVAHLCGLVANGIADDSSAGATAQNAAAIHFTVIESKTVQEGDHTVTYNRVAPPPISVVLPAATGGSATTSSDQGSAATLQQLKSQQQQTLVTVLVSATVFNHQISQLNWSVNGATYQGYSNIDFTVFPAATQFSVGNTTYNLLINAANLGPNPKAPAPFVVPSIPELPALTASQSAYVIVTTNGAALPDEAVAPIDSLHDYFDANSAAILAASAQRQADAAAQAQWAKDHPPAPKNTVINFWRIPATNAAGSNNP